MKVPEDSMPMLIQQKNIPKEPKMPTDGTLIREKVAGLLLLATMLSLKVKPFLLKNMANPMMRQVMIITETYDSASLVC